MADIEFRLGSDKESKGEETPKSTPEPKPSNQAALEALSEFFSKGKDGDFAGAHEAWQDYQALCEEA